jgi:hypothetical protein
MGSLHKGTTMLKTDFIISIPMIRYVAHQQSLWNANPVSVYCASPGICRSCSDPEFNSRWARYKKALPCWRPILPSQSQWLDTLRINNPSETRMRRQSIVLVPEYIGRLVFLSSLVDELGTKRHYHVEADFAISKPMIRYVAHQQSLWKSNAVSLYCARPGICRSCSLPDIINRWALYK